MSSQGESITSGLSVDSLRNEPGGIYPSKPGAGLNDYFAAHLNLSLFFSCF
jgi:hypothetical protein